MEIYYHSRFLRKFKKLNKDIKNLIADKEDIFKFDPFDSRLKTHKLHGILNDSFSFSINYKYRIIFKYINNDKDVIFYEIGNHDIYE